MRPGHRVGDPALPCAHPLPPSTNSPGQVPGHSGGSRTQQCLPSPPSPAAVAGTARCPELTAAPGTSARRRRPRRSPRERPCVLESYLRPPAKCRTRVEHAFDSRRVGASPASPGLPVQPRLSGVFSSRIRHIASERRHPAHLASSSVLSVRPKGPLCSYVLAAPACSPAALPSAPSPPRWPWWACPPSPQAAEPTTPFISEIHYDNAGADVDEFVEVEFPAGTSSAGWKVVLYNGNGGAVYDAAEPAAAPGGDGSRRRGRSTTRASDGIQNGAPDGLALVRPDGTVAEFLSYEGMSAAAEGRAGRHDEHRYRGEPVRQRGGRADPVAAATHRDPGAAVVRSGGRHQGPGRTRPTRPSRRPRRPTPAPCPRRTRSARSRAPVPPRPSPASRSPCAAPSSATSPASPASTSGRRR